MPKRLIITKVCFHITAALAFLCGLAMVVLFGPLAQVTGDLASGKTPDPDTVDLLSFIMSAMRSYLIVAMVFMWGFAAGVEVVIYNLSRLRYWAWIVGIVICGLMILPVLHGNLISAALGGLGLWGLLDPDTVRAFKPADNVSKTVDSRPSTED